MTSRGLVRMGDTTLRWDEQKNQIEIEPAAYRGPVLHLVTTYDGGRELLDCLMVLFDRMELTRRYPEAL